MIYVAQKPCSFAGIDFKIGEEVPEEAFAEEDGEKPDGK